jgi:Platelet-activating factor acetylhydrolase, isoform II
LFLANLLTFFVLTVSMPRAMFWMRYAAPVALLIAVLQALVEGSRWQMFPAYALSGLFFLVWLLQNFLPSSGTVGQSLTYWLAALLGVFGLVVSVVLPIILPVFRFTQPSGTYPIGTLTYHWLDADRQEIFSTDPKTRRELMVQIWYPAKDTASTSRAPYLQDADAISMALARLKHLPEFFLSQFKYVTTNAIASAPVADDKPNYPVLIFLEGAIGFRQMNTFQVEELVSHGYIVATIDQPYTAASVIFPDGHEVKALPLEQMKTLIHPSYSPAQKAPILNGRTLEKGIIGYLAQDVRFTLNQLATLNRADPNAILTGRLDLQHIGTFGVSLGGIVAGEACRLEPRLRACLVMDAAMPTDVVRFGLQQPTMWITRDAQTMRLERRRSGGWSESEIADHQTTMRATFEHLHGDGYFVQIPGMFHVNLTDIPYWSPLLSWMGITGAIDAHRVYSIINAYSLAFFDQSLKGRPSVPLEKLAGQFPEVIFETHKP